MHRKGNKISKKKWYNCILPTIKIDISIRFLKYLQKWRFPHLRQFLEWQRIHIHKSASDPLEKIYGNLDVTRLSPDEERRGWNTID